MNIFNYCFSDWVANRGNPKARIVLLAFRLASYLRASNRVVVILFFPYFVFYRVFFEWILGVEIPWKTKIGCGLRLFHGFGLVINDRAIIGENVVLRHCTTIGVAKTDCLGVGGAPVIGANVDVGSNVCILGDIQVGHDSVIGAGSVVVRDVPPYSVVVGNPARVIRTLG